MIRGAITRVSSGRVKVDGYKSTYGETAGSYFCFEGGRFSDSAGYFTTAYGVGKLSGNVIMFTANRTGKLASGGVLYPYRN